MITIFESVTLDGVTQGLGRADEDTRGGFVHGGWGDGYQDEVSMGFAAEGMSAGGGLLFGRRTYEDLLGYWTALDWTTPWLTAHAGRLLLDARELGFAVDSATMARLGDYLTA